MSFKSGFVSIVGKPNAGKSTLMNLFVGERLSIITPKAQTTRHKIVGIVNQENAQVIFLDTPGVIKPQYELHETMMSAVKDSLSDTDLALFITDIKEHFDEQDVLTLLQKAKGEIVVIINKIDLATEQEVKDKMDYWQETLQPKAIIPVSALHDFNVPAIWNCILDTLPEHPPYYDTEALTDRPERFFVSEIIREKIFNLYQKEIPYCSEVVITQFKDEPHIARIYAEIIVERDSQKNILIGSGGSMLKKVGTQARIDIEKFIDKKVYLELFVKVLSDWRNRKNYLKQFGYGD